MHRRIPFVVALILLTAFTVACSHTSVRHLARNPFQLDQPKQLSLKFWKFSYDTKASQDSFEVSGTAIPLVKNIPDWAVHVDELWLEAYVADAKGFVLARDLFILDPAKFDGLDKNSGVPFVFRLKPEKLVGGPLYISFGYRMTLSGNVPDENGGSKKKVFFGNESAVTRF